MGEILRDGSQASRDMFYAQHGPCCAGCDWWAAHNSVVGDCTRSAPVSAGERCAMLGMMSVSFNPGAGHVLTPREHVCGDFKDDFDWSALPLIYRRFIGMTTNIHNAAQSGGEGER